MTILCANYAARLETLAITAKFVMSASMIFPAVVLFFLVENAMVGFMQNV